MDNRISRLVVAGLSGDSGKTIVSLSLLAGFRQKGLTVSAFKKGPDYIDPAWLSQAAGSVCRNLDTFLAGADCVLKTFVTHAANSDIAVIEGNRGLYDGQDAVGTHSTAQLSKLLRAPVILVVDATKATRTVAAMVKGCQVMDPDVVIAGVVLNRVGGERHRRVITEAIEQSCRLPVVGAIPRLGRDSDIIPGRHLGLVPPTEYAAAGDYRGKLLMIAREHLDLERMIATAGEAEPLKGPAGRSEAAATREAKIGYFTGSAFTFYYPENLEALEAAGAELVPVDPAQDEILPALDGLYIGGGFPETHAEQLAVNRSMMAAVKHASDGGMPIYAECGGLIYLSRSITWQSEKHSMAGVFPVDLEVAERPIGHGYSRLRVAKDNPFFDAGEEFKGHEFHYSGPATVPQPADCCMEVLVGTGLGNKLDGLQRRSTVAVYTHLHAGGAVKWAPRFVQSAREFSRQQADTDSSGDEPDVNESNGRRVA